jgi:transposase
MDDALLDLPDDPVELKRVIAQQRSLITQRDNAIVQIKRQAAEQLEAMTQRHKAEMDAVLRRFYGPHAERFDPTQLLLFGITIDELPVDHKTVEAESGQKLKTKRVNHHKHGRGQLPAHLPRLEIVHDLNDQQKKCPCCGKDRVCIGSEISEQLEFDPASLKVLKHVRHKYACGSCGNGCDQCDCKSHIEIATKTPQPIEKGLAGPGLLAYLITSKLADHLPLYRLEDIFSRQGVDISRSTMCAWMLAAGQLIDPLVELITTRVKQGRVIHTDDTRVPVQDRTVKGKCKSGRIWTYIGDESNPYIVYDYTPDRTRAGPQRFLADYKGYLQADAYGGYDGVYHKGTCGEHEVIEVACWAHARRKFFDAKETDGKRAAAMLEMVQELYGVEDQAKSLDDEQRRQLRQQQSVPILQSIKCWIDEQLPLTLPRSPMAQAMQYTLNQWDALNRYTEQGYLNIDNNAAERALKRVAIGRKNWLFAGNDDAAANHARLYTLIASAQRHGLDPQAYLTSVLAKISSTPLSELNQFLPDVWKADSQREPTSGASIAVSPNVPAQ